MTNLSDLKHIALRGEGYFCIVKKYEDEPNKKSYALKELKKEHYLNEEYRYRLLREIKLLEELQDCPNIIGLINYGNDVDNQKLWYLMPLAPYNLFDYIRKNNDKIDLSERYGLAEQVINAIKFAHAKGILHRDISPNNVLIFLKENDKLVKVCDFGLGKNKDSLSYYTTSSASGYGQILYVSPEQRVHLKDATTKSDIFSLGRLIYFIFTGKDPDNIKPFPLSSLVAKATEDNPENRFTNIEEFEKHFLALKELHLNQKIPKNALTLDELLKSASEKDFITIHDFFVKGNYLNHVYDDYISPVNTFLMERDNLNSYYKVVGSGIREFAQTYSNRLYECYQTTRWPFSSMNTFGEVLRKIIENVTDDETKLICIEHMWYLAFVADQWKVQKLIKSVLTEKYVSKAIETQLSEFIISTAVEVNINIFSDIQLPSIIKVGIIKSSDIAIQNKIEREKKIQDEVSNWDL